MIDVIRDMASHGDCANQQENGIFCLLNFYLTSNPS